MHLPGTGKEIMYVCYIHIAGINIRNQEPAIDEWTVSVYALVLLYTMPSEAEAFYCLEKFVEKCPVYVSQSSLRNPLGRKV